MSKINILDSEIFTRIAAGEVVERPRSIVKELVENSLDAGAQSITIEIVGGGIDLIKVTDDGCGIEKSEIHKAFLPHATSKISVQSDLDAIATLGFRGEALSSVAAVANVTITSRVRGSELCEFMCVDGGIEVSRGEIGGAFGTSVLVTDLFSKIPARKKFLGKVKAEENEITNLVARLILANSDISIKYIANSKVVYQSRGMGIRDAVCAVYGFDMLDNLVEVDVNKGDLHVYGLVSRPGHSKYSRSFQTLVVGGRYVVDTEISYAVFTSLKDYLMTRQYPMYILFIDLPADMVDVNIHPGKLQVRFAQPKRVIATVKEAVEGAIYGVRSVVEEIKTESLSPNSSAKNSKNQPYTQSYIYNESENELRAAKNLYKNSLENSNANSDNANSDVDSIAESAATMSQNYTDLFEQNVTSEVLFGESSNQTGDWQRKGSSFAGNKFGNSFRAGEPTLRERSFHSIIGDIFSSNSNSGNKTNDNSGNDNNCDSLEKDFQTSCDGVLGAQFRCVGKIFDTYIMLEVGNNLFMIDQHAAHERLLFDKLYAAAQSSTATVQPLLIPYEFSLSLADAEIIDENLSELKSCGLIIESMGEGRFALVGVPLIAAGFDEREFVYQLTEMLNSKTLSAARLVRERIISAACKAAIKGGDDLSDIEIESLLKAMTKSEIVYCPHGRPVAIRLSRGEIEKLFKRKL